MDNFRRLSPHIAECVYAPEIHWKLSTSKLLVMEFIDGAQINDYRTIQKLGVQPSDVSKLVSLRASQYQIQFDDIMFLWLEVGLLFCLFACLYHQSSRRLYLLNSIGATSVTPLLNWSAWKVLQKLSWIYFLFLLNLIGLFLILCS